MTLDISAIIWDFLFLVDFSFFKAFNKAPTQKIPILHLAGCTFVWCSKSRGVEPIHWRLRCGSAGTSLLIQMWSVLLIANLFFFLSFLKIIIYAFYLEEMAKNAWYTCFLSGSQGPVLFSSITSQKVYTSSFTWKTT